MGVDADHAVEALAHLGDDLRQPPGERAAVGVAQAEHVGAGLLRGFERAQRVIRVGGVAVEEVLGVVDHFLAVRPSGSSTVSEISLRFSSRVMPSARLHVQVPRLAENRDHRRAGLHQRAHVAVLLHRVLGETRGAEGGQPGVLQVQVARRGAKNSLSLGLEPGQPPSM